MALLSSSCFLVSSSKQRHNKLWRSHSDSDLSEGHELLCKAPRPLDRSDPHNNNNGAPSLQQVLGIDVRDSFTDPQPVVDNAHPKSPARVDPFLPPRRRQRAATVVPEQNMAKNSRLRVAVTEPVACHPPPSLHILAPSPEEESGITPDLDIQSSHHVPEPKTDCVELSPDTPDQNDSYHVSESTASQKLELCLDAVSNDEGDLPSSSTPEADSSSEAVHELCSSDDNNNPNVADSSENAAASHLSTDSIDFFSAREKFLCLSQDSQPRTLSEPTDVRPLHSKLLEGPSEEADEVRFGTQIK